MIDIPVIIIIRKISKLIGINSSNGDAMYLSVLLISTCTDCSSALRASSELHN